MTFVTGDDPNRGHGRPKGLLNKRTQVLEGLKLVYGDNAEVAFWAQAARAARGMTAKEAVDNGLLPEDAQLPCLHSYKMIADRITPTLKPVEVPLPALGEGKQITDTELTERLVAQLVKAAPKEVLDALKASEDPLESAPKETNQPKTPRIASTVGEEDKSEIIEQDREVTEE